MTHVLPTGLLWVVFAGCIGAVAGSFANMVIHRLPRMLEHRWMREASDATGGTFTDPAPPDLFRPASHCPTCGQALRWWQNIPIVSFIALRGRCAHCQAAIPTRYLLTELVMTAWFVWCATYHDPAQATAWFWSVWGACLITLAIIDWRTFLLPDPLTLGLLWLSLVAAALGLLPVSPTQAIWGAAVGYLVVFLPGWVFERVTGRTGMAHGDFKLMAAVGAAVGPSQVILTLLVASLLGIAMALLARRWMPQSSTEGGFDVAPGAIPFGPAIAAAAMVLQVWPLDWLAIQ